MPPLVLGDRGWDGKKHLRFRDLVKDAMFSCKDISFTMTWAICIPSTICLYLYILFYNEMAMLSWPINMTSWHQVSKTMKSSQSLAWVLALLLR